MKIRTFSGNIIEVTHVRHLATETPRNSLGGGNVDVDLCRTSDGILVVVTSPTNDGRVIPTIDPDSTPAQYGYYGD